jgi:hypothetical protein
VEEPTGADAGALKAFRQIKHACWLLDADELQWQPGGAKKVTDRWSGQPRWRLKEHPKFYWTSFAHHSLGLVYFDLGKHPLHAQVTLTAKLCKEPQNISERRHPPQIFHLRHHPACI